MSASLEDVYSSNRFVYHCCSFRCVLADEGHQRHGLFLCDVVRATLDHYGAKIRTSLSTYCFGNPGYELGEGVSSTCAENKWEIEHFPMRGVEPCILREGAIDLQNRP